MSDELILSQAAYHIRKHYREEYPEDISRFMIVEKVKEENNKTSEPKIGSKNTKKVKPAKEKEELAKCKLWGSESVAFTFEESMAEHLENYHRISEIIDLPSQRFYEGVSA